MQFTTERCTLRPFRAEDMEAFMAYRNNMEWMRYQGFKGLSREQYENALLAPLSLAQGAQLAVTDRQTGTLLGDVYLQQDGDTCWVGYTIAPQYARRGYAFEAVSGLIAQLAAAGTAYLKAGAESGNAASIALLQKLGFTPLGEDDGERIFGLPLR